LAIIPYDDYSRSAIQTVELHDFKFPAQEWLYRSSILAFLQGCGVVVFAELHSNKGRSDLVLFHKGKTWVIEIKVAYEGDNPAKKAEEAYRQIIDNNYAKPYLYFVRSTQYPDAICVGLAIDDEKRQITEEKTVKP